MLIPKPPHANVVRSMWLFRHKYHADGSLSSLVVKPATIRTVLSLVLSRGWHVHQLNVKNVFLNGDILKTVYMYPVHGFNGLLVMLYTLVSVIVDVILPCLFMAVRKYAMELLERAHMVYCNPSRTPVDTKSKLARDKDLLFASSTGSLIAYSDADWAGCPSIRWSTSGYCVFFEDNLLSSNLVQHQRTKHIEIDIHFVRDMVTKGQVRVHVSSRYQYADIFTKGLPSTLFEEFRSSLSVRSSPAQTAGEY
ncbi:ribonuclease H-like domain-containing protein [Tanacetum coccineum]